MCNELNIEWNLAGGGVMGPEGQAPRSLTPGCSAAWSAGSGPALGVWASKEVKSWVPWGWGLARGDAAHAMSTERSKQSERPAPNLPTRIIPAKIRWLEISGTFPVEIWIPPLRLKILLESNPLKSRILARRLAIIAPQIHRTTSQDLIGHMLNVSTFIWDHRQILDVGTALRLHLPCLHGWQTMTL